MALPLPWRNPIEPHTRNEWIAESPARLYDILDAYYGNLDVYEDVQAALWERGLFMPGMKAIRNPAFRTVEFYASKLWPGALPDALPIAAPRGGELNAAIVPAIHQVWTWSNWSAQKQVAARQLATLGDLFIKVAQTDNRQRVFFQLIHPKDVIEFDTDERGFITYIRIDVLQHVRDGDKVTQETLTEVWDKTEFRRWHHTRGAGARTDALGTPTEQVPLASFGIDFVPVVHTMFRDVGRDRGVGAFTPALDKIDEANRMATRLHQMLFRNSSAVWAMSANALDKEGRPLPPPALAGADGTITPGTVSWGDDSLVRLPGMATLQPLVPNLDYGGALAILQDHMQEIEKDLPELAYYRLRELAQVSGVAVRMLLSDAIDRLLEARGNAEGALIRANQMALTIGVNARLFGNLGGTYESGAFDHAFAERSVIDLTETEEALADRQAAETLVIKRELGVSGRQALEELGYTEEQIEQMATEQEAQAAAAGAAALRAFDAGAGQ